MGTIKSLCLNIVPVFPSVIAKSDPYDKKKATNKKLFLLFCLILIISPKTENIQNNKKIILKGQNTTNKGAWAVENSGSKIKWYQPRTK